MNQDQEIKIPLETTDDQKLILEAVLSAITPKYEFIEFIQRGGYGSVYKAKDRNGNTVAIKQIPFLKRKCASNEIKANKTMVITNL